MEDKAVIVVHRDGRVQFWLQDAPELLEILDTLAEMSTCDCLDDQCHADEMPEWRRQLTEDCIVPESALVNGSIIV